MLTLHLVGLPPDWLMVLCTKTASEFQESQSQLQLPRDFNRMPRVMEPDGQLGFLILLADSLGLYTLVQSNSNPFIGRRILFAQL